ncbi:MAG: cysteine--tRNA ligase [Francisellaceae bacterium]|nr:cysteine--tRNA ligase [Francisellaceae bacterium]MBT6208097.1 cysteine--tRNA ligase [Francisellaceae bacterium]MBT6539134.1 cysteine--tRNA ligase [Francisellaceae bacterium]
MKIYNTVTRKKEEFTPLVANEIGLYTCGITVYDLCHIGHARTFIAFDTIVKYLRYRGYSVNYVRNITDIDDKIIKRANEQGISSTALAVKYIDAMHEDMDVLGLTRPDHEPRATQYMKEMIELITGLIDKGYAYAADNGDVYYSVHKKENYGQLVAYRKLDDLKTGARISVNDNKNDPLDFVLWKSAKPNEPSWESPWGSGRPGWHLECSAMSMSILGQTFDIHGGGYDLIFPHHENECAQSEAFSGKKFAKYWMHVGFMQVNAEKMSKSLGNFATIRDVLKDYHPETLKYFINSGHYRSPLEYCPDSLQQATVSLERFYIALRNINLTAEITITSESLELESRFVDAMDDDFNTPKALAVLFDIAKKINLYKVHEDDSKSQELGALLIKLASILGILQVPIDTYFNCNRQNNILDDDKIESMIQERNDARVNKNWTRADEIRDWFQEHSIIVEDGAAGTTWRYKNS